MVQATIDIKNDFLPIHTFECGQCFRWNRQEDGSYTGVAFGKAVNIQGGKDGIIIKGSTQNEADSFWRTYLDLDRDYSAIKKRISGASVMREASDFGWGIRILKQDFFESLFSFIISQRSSIPKIKTCIERICAKYGEKVELGGNIYYSFPSPERLKDVTGDDYAKFGVGYRAPYLERAVHGILCGDIDESAMKNMSTLNARESLMKIYGVGNKVADCVLLFGLARFDSFPVDVWIKRAMDEYFDGKDGYGLFGEDSGFAQQYLFYWERNCKEKMNKA